MPKWEHQETTFNNNGLDLIHDPIDAGDGVFTILDNCISNLEGCLESRPGISVINNVPFSGRVTSAHFINDPVNNVYSTVIGAGTDIYVSVTPTTSAVLGSGFSSNPKTFATYRPELSESPVCYIGDSDRMAKAFYKDSKWNIQNIGIAPPPFPISYGTIQNKDVADMITIDTFETDLSLSNVSSASLTSIVGATKKSQSVEVSTVTTTSYHLTSITPSVTGNIKKTFSPYLDLSTRCNDDSKLEFFIYTSEPDAIMEIRIMFLLDDTKENYYIYKLYRSDIEAAYSGSTESATIPDRSYFEEQIAGESEWYVSFGDYEKQAARDREIERRMAEWTNDAITAAQTGWKVFSINRGDFVRIGSSSSRSWKNVHSVMVEMLAWSTDAIFALYDMTITTAGGLDSTNGLPYKWMYSYFNQNHGVESNPCPAQVEGPYLTERSMPISMAPSPDEQATHVKLYRQGGSTRDYHLVETFKIGDASNSPYFEYDIGSVISGTPMGVSVTASSGMDFALGDHVLITSSVASGSTLSALNGVWQVQPVTSGSAVKLYLLGSNSCTATVSGKVKTFKYTDNVPDSQILFNDSPRFDLDQPVTTMQSRTNLVKYSEDYSKTEWTKTDLSVVSSSDNSPVGGGFVSLISSVATNAYLLQSVVFPTTQKYTGSIYVQRVTGDGDLSIMLDGTTWIPCNIKDSPDDRWDRIIYTTTVAAGTHNVGLKLDMGSGSDESYQIYGFQVEDKDLVNTYLKTTGQSETVIEGTKKAACLPVIFGPFLGKYIFGLGDTSRPGFLYWCNEQNPDAWSPLNAIEVTSPSDPLQNGCIFDGKVYVFSREAMYVIYPALTTGGDIFQVLPTSCNVGMWSKYALTIGDRMWFLSGRGIMETVGGEAVNISQHTLIRPLFENKQVGDYYPVDWTLTTTTDYDFNLRYCEPYLYFCYKDTNGGRSMMVYHTIMKRWHCMKFPTGVVPAITFGIQQIHGTGTGTDTYFGSVGGKIYIVTGHEDTTATSPATVTAPIACKFSTPEFSQGSTRIEKMYGDLSLDIDGNGATVSCIPRIDLGETDCDTVSVATTTKRRRYIVPIKKETRSGISEAPISKSIGLEVSWNNTSTNSPVFYGVDVTYSGQADISNRTTDWSDLGNPMVKYIWGAVLDIDTYGNTLIFDLYADGLYYTSVSVPGALGRRKAEVSWPVLQASFVRMVAQSDEGYMLYGDIEWYFHTEAPRLTNWHTYWEDLAEGSDAYLYGVDIEGDTYGKAKSIILERDGGINICTENITLDGHSKQRITFPPVKANTVRIRSTDDITGFLYKTKWIFSPEPPLVEDWDTNYENDGDLNDKWISGLYLEADTEGATKHIEVFVDGINHGVYPVYADGRTPVKIAFTPIRGVSMKFTSKEIFGRLYQYRWIYENEPVQLSNMATNWTNLDWPYEKLLKGVAIEHDTHGQTKKLRVAINGDEDGYVGDEIQINSNGRAITMHHLPNVLAETMRLVPTDNNTGRLYSVKWIYDREPVSMELWETQESTFNAKTYTTIRDCYIAIRCDSPVIMLVYSDGNQDSYMVDSTGGERRKVRISMMARKARVWKFKFVSGTDLPFKIYVSDCTVNVKAWGDSGEYTPYVLPFPGGE